MEIAGRVMFLPEFCQYENFCKMFAGRKFCRQKNFTSTLRKCFSSHYLPPFTHWGSGLVTLTRTAYLMLMLMQDTVLFETTPSPHSNCSVWAQCHDTDSVSQNSGLCTGFPTDGAGEITMAFQAPKTAAALQITKKHFSGSSTLRQALITNHKNAPANTPSGLIHTGPSS